MKQRAEDSKPLNECIIEMMERFGAQLLAAGLKEPDRESRSWHWMFYRPETELTAFAVNLQGKEDCVEIIYGFASTAFLRMDGIEPSQAESITIDDTDMAVRQKEIIWSFEDERAAEERIRALYEAYRFMEKDALLADKKARQKRFLDTIAVLLKPLGFKKKGTRWTKALTDGFSLEFHAQKSAFSDRYYFNVSIHRENVPAHCICYYTRLALNNQYLIDWQTTEKDEWRTFAEETAESTLRLLSETPLTELGRLPHIWESCHCRRECCGDCWVQKKPWEAKKQVSE